MAKIDEKNDAVDITKLAAEKAALAKEKAEFEAAKEAHAIALAAQKAEAATAVAVLEETTIDTPEYDQMEELVPFYATKDSNKYKDDIFVAVNGETMLIKRGVHVKIKRKFADVLTQSDTQSTVVADLVERGAEPKQAAAVQG